MLIQTKGTLSVCSLKKHQYIHSHIEIKQITSRLGQKTEMYSSQAKQ